MRVTFDRSTLCAKYAVYYTGEYMWKTIRHSTKYAMQYTTQALHDIPV